MLRSIAGSEIRPIATTVAPRMPVVAASSAPTKDDRDAQTARNRPEQLRHGQQQILGDLRPLQHDAHEHEQRNRDQRVAFDFPVDAAESW